MVRGFIDVLHGSWSIRVPRSSSPRHSTPPCVRAWISAFGLSTNISNRRSPPYPRSPLLLALALAPVRTYLSRHLEKRTPRSVCCCRVLYLPPYPIFHPPELFTSPTRSPYLLVQRPDTSVLTLMLYLIGFLVAHYNRIFGSCCMYIYMTYNVLFVCFGFFNLCNVYGT